jgi:hypothetical protein
MEKTMKQKMYTLLRERIEDFSDHVYKVCHRPKHWIDYFPYKVDQETLKEDDIKRMRQLYKNFTDALELFAECDMIPDEVYNEYHVLGHLLLREGAQAIRHFYTGRRWFEEPYDETCRLRNNN